MDTPTLTRDAGAADAPNHPHADAIRATAQQLWSAEGAVDLALRETALLVVRMIDGRVAAGLAPCVIHAAMRPVAETAGALFASRSSLIGAHRQMRRVQERIGAGDLHLGGLNKNPHDDAVDSSWWPFGFSAAPTGDGARPN